MRLLTRSDFDGLACGALLKQLGVIDSWKFVHPKDMQDGLVEVTDRDVLANVPYVEGCALWFDHHSSEADRIGFAKVPGASRLEDSTARLIYDFYDGRDRIPQFEEMVQAVDKVDAAKLSVDEIMNPTGWVLLGFIMDPRTGLGRFQNFEIPNYELMEKLMNYCATKGIDEILADSDVKERIDLYFEQSKAFKEMLEVRTRTEANIIITDLRGVSPICAGNRFLIYSLYPEQNISIWITDGRDKRNCAIAIGHSIISRTSSTDVGKLTLKFGGGGHRQVGTCQVPYAEADSVIEQIIAQIKADG